MSHDRSRGDKSRGVPASAGPSTPVGSVGWFSGGAVCVGLVGVGQVCVPGVCVGAGIKKVTVLVGFLKGELVGLPRGGETGVGISTKQSIDNLVI